MNFESPTKRESTVAVVCLVLGLASTANAQALIGTRSCAAAACHGSVVPDAKAAVRRDEFFRWFEHDKHARAYETLDGSLGRAILENLRITPKMPAFQGCLACHSPADRSNSPAATAAQHEGVSCEACHGPAEKWRDKHYLRTWNKERDPVEHGMIVTKHLPTRARLCAECHVGTPQQQVNHDLIAAGHPPLKFELTAYQSLMPKHWDERKVRKAQPDHELDLWHAGQSASATAALDLLEHRAADKSQPWPEFAETNCFSCHHDISADGWRPERSKSVPTWGSWYFPLWQRAASQPLAKLTETFNHRLIPERSDVAKAIEPVRTAIASSQRPLRAELLTRVNELAKPDEAGARAVGDWDVATQAYLALVAVDVTHRDRLATANRKPSDADQQITRRLQELRSLLAFPPQFASPRKFVNSPSASPRRRFADELRDVIQLLQQRPEP